MDRHATEQNAGEGNAADGFPGKLPNPFSYSTAHQEYQWVVRHSLQQLRSLIEERSSEYGDEAEKYVPWHRDVVLHVINVQLYACITVESLLNFWATLRIGTRGLARIDQRGLESKLVAIVRRIHKVDLPEESEIRQAVRRLVAVRNELVHPKAIVGGPDDYVPASEDPPRLSDAEAARVDMQIVVDFLVKSDPDMWSLAF